MADNSFVVTGIITLVVNAFTFKVKLENGSEIVCVLNGKMKFKHVHLFPNDKVKVEISMYDLTKGRIIDIAK